MPEHDKLFMTNTARDAAGSPDDPRAHIQSIFRMIFIIQRVWVKACYEDYVFDSIWISTTHIASTSCEAVWHVIMSITIVISHFCGANSVLYEPLMERLVEFHREQKK